MRTITLSMILAIIASCELPAPAPSVPPLPAPSALPPDSVRTEQVAADAASVDGQTITVEPFFAFVPVGAERVRVHSAGGVVRSAPTPGRYFVYVDSTGKLRSDSTPPDGWRYGDLALVGTYLVDGRGTVVPFRRRSGWTTYTAAYNNGDIANDLRVLDVFGLDEWRSLDLRATVPLWATTVRVLARVGQFGGAEQVDFRVADVDAAGWHGSIVGFPSNERGHSAYVVDLPLPAEYKCNAGSLTVYVLGHD